MPGQVSMEEQIEQQLQIQRPGGPAPQPRPGQAPTASEALAAPLPTGGPPPQATPGVEVNELGYATAPPQPQPQDQGLARIERWVAAVEGHIQSGSPPEAVASSLVQDLPPDAAQSLVQNPIEAIVQEITAFVKTQGILESPQGIAYLKQVQQVLRQAVQAAQSQAVPPTS